MGARVLVIEDNRDNLELMSYLLEAFGHVALRARDGQEGLSMAGREMPDLILCDIQLPKMDGYTISRTLSATPNLRSIPRLAVTALAMAGDKEKVMAAGFHGYIPKPIEPELFVSQIEKFFPGPPPASSSPAPESGGEAHPAGEQRAVILAVDNIRANIELLRYTLEPAGFRVLAASTAEGAMRAALDHHPDLILSDVHMPAADGFELLQSVKANPELTAIPFVFLSSSVLRDDERRAISSGADRFINRSIEPARLLAVVEEMVKGRQAK